MKKLRELRSGRKKEAVKGFLADSNKGMLGRTAVMVTAVILSFVMTFALAGCAGTESGSGSTSANAVSAGKTAAEENPGEASSAEDIAEGGTGADSEEAGGTDSFIYPGKKTDGTSAWEDASVQEITKAAGDVSLKDDFYMAVNRDWILSASLPDGYSSYDNFIQQSLELENQLVDILEDSEKETDSALAHDQELTQNYYELWMDWDSRNEQGFQPLAELMEPLNGIQTLDDLTEYLARPETVISATELLLCDAGVDWNNADYNTVYIAPMELIFRDAMYYQYMEEGDEMNEPYYNEFIRYELIGMGFTDDEATEILEDCFAFEKAVAEDMMTTSELSASDAVEKENNPFTLQELKKKAGAFPIEKILAAYGVEDSDSFILMQPDWLDTLAGLYTEEHVEEMKAYLLCCTAQQYATLLDRDTYDKYYDVLGGISGASGTVDDRSAAAEAVSDFIPMQLGRLYCDRYVTDETKEEITDITEDIVAEYRNMLQSEDFLSSATRREAVRKLDSLTLRIAEPDKWEDDSDLSFSGPDDGGTLVHAQEEVGAYWVQQLHESVNSEVDRDVWSSMPQQVNAFYDPTDNSITLCPGILGGSFYSSDMTREQIMATVGDMVAHEISHAFDTTGSQFDEKGNLRNWWTAKDSRAFAKKAQKLVDYYDDIEPFEGIYCNGAQIEGEAIADLVAMKILLLIADDEDSFDYESFFTKFAQTWRSISTVQTEYYSLSQDSHPLNYLRVDAVLQQYEEFYETFGVDEGDGMYLKPADRLIVW